MSRARYLVFSDVDPLLAAIATLRTEGVGEMEAHTPFHVPELAAALGLPSPRLRPVMLTAGLLVALATFGLQYWSAVIDYPINSGGRPLNSWPAFGLATFEMGVLAAAFSGFVTLLISCGLPRLHHPFFATARTEAASDDRFYLVIPVVDAPDRLRLSELPGLVEVFEAPA
jgi:hypothetical protein